jgi:ribosomal protein S18 acetylase RimI-like enzyme
MENPSGGLTVRPAGPQDLQGLLALCSSRPYAALPARGVSGEERRRVLLEGYRNHWGLLGQDPNLQVLVGERTGSLAGYLVLVTGLKESITGEPLALIYDYAGEVEALAGRAVEEAAGRGARHLVLEVSPRQPDEERRWEGLGFRVDMNRIARPLGPPGPLPESPYRVRRAGRQDRLFLMWLNTLTSSFTIPAGREGERERIAAAYLDTYAGLDFAGDPRAPVFVVELSGRPAGYLMLRLGYHDEVTGHEVAYIYDLAIHPEHWGRRAVHRLLREVEAWLFAHGVRVLLGDVSQSNPRALKTALRALGFELEWRRWTRELPG